jgi:poly-gamma-glutamate capsule biosynthesis protein CapA/YwtB (metallophosphatase superfamily)
LTRVRRRWLKVVALVLAVVGLLFVGSEYLYYFPLTPLSLDPHGTTQLPPSSGRARLLFTGDILLGDAGEGLLARRGLDHPFGATRQLLAAADLAVGNLEGPITRSSRPERATRWSYRMPPDAAAALAGAGFHALNLGNNHVLDCGPSGLRETIELLRAANLEPFGAGSTIEEAHRPVVRVVRGVSVGLLGYLPEQMLLDDRPFSLMHLAVGPSHAGTATGEPRRMAQDIAELRRRVPLVVVSLHLGDRYQRGPSAYERALCHRAIEAGADAVVGHGPHILGPMELYRGKPILYSLGNFAFGSGNVRARYSLLAVLELDVAARRLRAVQALPIYTVNRNPWVNFQAKVLVGAQARQVLRGLATSSLAYGTRVAIEEHPTRATLRF